MKIFRNRIQIFLLSLFLLLPLTGQAITTENGKSFFSPQPISVTMAPQTAMFEEFARKHSDGEERFFFSATPFYTKSQAAQNLRRYFFPGGKDELVIAGSDVPAGTNYDISGTWLKIMGSDAPAGLGLGLLFNNFQSKMSLNPVYENLGANFNFHKSIGKSFFIAGECAVLQSKVTHGLTEYAVEGQTARKGLSSISYTAGAEVRHEPESRLYSLNATEAFTNPSWQYGKLALDSLKKEGLSDLNLRVGLQLERGSLFVKAVLPTSQKPTAQYMFEPLTGNGSHLGFGFGGLLDFEKELHFATLKIFNKAEYVYLLENTQLRTFDLNDNGQWSRYLIMRELGHVNSSPGVNYLTLKTNVTPGHTFNWQSLLGLQIQKIRLNAGYNFAFADQEALQLSGNNFATQFNIADEQLTDDATINGVANVDISISDSFLPQATIHDSAGNSFYAIGNQNVPQSRINALAAGAVKSSNINMQSAQQAAKLMSQISFAAGFEEIANGYPVAINVGYSYNFDHNKTALASWSMWLQAGLKI